jgi:transcriptional regulator with XRE-family HTH domain
MRSKPRKHVFNQKKSGDYIRFLRKQLNLTQEDVAQHSSITRSHISNVEKGISRFSFEDYMSIAELYRNVSKQRFYHAGYDLQWFDLVNGFKSNIVDEKGIQNEKEKLEQELKECRSSLKTTVESLHLALRRGNN